MLSTLWTLGLFAFTAWLAHAGPLPAPGSPNVGQQRAACDATLVPLLEAHLLDTTVVTVEHVAANSFVNTSTGGPAGILTGTPCQATAQVAADLCRVVLSVRTSNSSGLRMEAWLPDEFFGRLLGTGNGGLNGCIEYTDMAVGSAQHFATVGTNNGHDGDTGVFFFGHPEVIRDFAFRSIEREAVLGKQIVSLYYGADSLGKSYYSGCSTGGRQGFKMVQSFPDLFDGVIAGSPALDWNHLLGTGGVFGTILGTAGGHQGLLSNADLNLVTADVLAQCDALDGVTDGIIDDPDTCDYRPENLLCPLGAVNTTSCLSPEKVVVVRQIFTPLFGTTGELLLPRFDPGATGLVHPLFGPGEFPYTLDWFRFVIFNDTAFTGVNFTVADVEFAQRLDPSGISTMNADIQPFLDRGGKILTYHGTQDFLIPSGNSRRYYNDVATTLQMPTLDSFYRLFTIPGMGHCSTGPGAWQFGQSGTDIRGLANDTSSNILLALVDWVENGRAPDGIVGTKFMNDLVTEGIDSQRLHCPYPSRSVLKPGGIHTEAAGWECKALAT